MDFLPGLRAAVRALVLLAASTAFPLQADNTPAAPPPLPLCNELRVVPVDPPSTAPAPPQCQPAPLAGATDTPAATQLETVVVTGELLKREARRTTSSVAVTSGTQIERSPVRDVYDVIRDVPNVSTNDDSSGYGSITIRGISSYGGLTNGGSYIYGSATGIVLDGVNLPREAQGYADLSAFDLDRVEVLRGPQSTSLGRNAMAGGILIESAAPRLAPESGLDSLLWRGRFSGSDEAGYQLASSIDVTPIADTLGLRLGVDHRAVRGDIPNVTLNQDNWARDSSHGNKLRLAWQPGGPESAYRALVSVRDLDRLAGSRYVEQSRERERVATANEPSDNHVQAQLYSLEQDLALGRRFSLRAVSAYVRVHTISRFDLDYSADDSGKQTIDQPAREFSQELRARYEGTTLRGTLGAFYSDHRDSTVGDADFSVNALAAYAGLCTPTLLCSAPLGTVATRFGIPTHTVDMAGFGEADWRVLPRLTLTAGLRLDREQSDRDNVSETSGDTAAAQALVLALQAASVYGPNGTTPVSRTFSTVLPKAAVVYEFVDGWFAGLSHTQGYRPGGGGYNASTQRRFEFDAEHTYNYELSLKGGYQPWRLEGTLAAFHTDWKNMQVITGSGFDLYVDNAGLSKVDGGELELRFRPLQSLRVIGGLGISKGVFVDYKSASGDYSGNPLPRAPKRSASLALEWQPLKDVLIRPDLRYTGGTPAQPDDLPTHQLPAYTVVDLSLRWRRGPVTLFANGTNLADRFYRTDATTFGLTSKNVSSIGPDRRFTAGLDFEFR